MRVRELSIGGMLALALVIFGILNPEFVKLANLATIARASAFTGIMAVGIAFLLISGMIDISVGAIAGLAAIVTSSLIVTYGAPIWFGYAAGITAGGIAGWLNSRLVLKVRLPAFLATIGTMYIYRGLAMYLSNGYTIYPLPAIVGAFGTATPLGVSWHFWIFIGIVIVSQLALSYTVWGLTVRATGSDRETARNLEVNVNRVNTQTFVICGILAAVAGMLLMSRIITGQPTIGQGWELNAITAAAIGGVSLFGYEGSMIGVLLGVLLIQVIQNGLVVIGASVYLQQVEVGAVLLVTAAVDYQRREKLNLGA